MDIYYDTSYDLYGGSKLKKRTKKRGVVFKFLNDTKGGKIEVKYLNKLLNQSYNNKSNTATNIDDRYILDSDLSTDKTKVYKDTKTGEISMVNRGTSGIRDAISDVKLLFGYRDSRFDEGRKILQQIKEKYPNTPIDALGHSLGASVAEDLGKDPAIKNVITLNKPTVPTDIFKSKKNNDKQYDIRTTGDIVSMLQPLQKDTNDIVIPSSTKNLYTEHKIDTLDRLNQDLIVGKGFKRRLKKNEIKRLIKHTLKMKNIKQKYNTYDLELLKSLL